MRENQWESLSDAATHLSISPCKLTRHCVQFENDSDSRIADVAPNYSPLIRL